MLIIIEAPHFVAAYDTVTGQIAPIIKYMLGWKLERIERYCGVKKWTLRITT